jgi:hypothetical protein
MSKHNVVGKDLYGLQQKQYGEEMSRRRALEIIIGHPANYILHLDTGRH